MLPARKTNPVMKIMSQSLLDLPAPMNLSLWWNYGSLLLLFLITQILTGIFLSMHYSPQIEMAFSSLTHITRDVNKGWLLHNIHMNGASMFMMCMYLHMARGIYYHSFLLKNTWNSGVSLFILSMITAFTGYVLPWGQMSFWAATVITNIFSAIPYLGKQLVEWLWGGFSVSAPTLNRFFMMHFLLPFIILLMVMAHFMLLHEKGSNNPLGINSNSDRIPFHTYYMSKDIMGLMMIISIFIAMNMYYPNYFNDPENFIKADPLNTPTHIQPEWYFLWLYAILRSIPNKIGGVVALLSAIFILYTLPMTQTNHKKISNFYPMKQLMFSSLITSWLMLSWIGKCSVQEPFIKIGQLFTVAYFLYFLLMFLM